MQIHINTHHSMDSKESFLTWASNDIADNFSRFANRVTRIEVHLSDENADKSSANDKKCTMEARVEGRPPIAVTHHAESVPEALMGASTKLKKSLDKIVDKITHHKGHTPTSGEPFEGMRTTEEEREEDLEVL